MNEKDIQLLIQKSISRGIRNYVMELCLFTLIFCLFMGTIKNLFNVGVDTTDKDAWNRSGMSLHTDNATGIQYVGKLGGLTVRLNADGTPYRIKE